LFLSLDWIRSFNVEFLGKLFDLRLHFCLRLHIKYGGCGELFRRLFDGIIFNWLRRLDCRLFFFDFNRLRSFLDNLFLFPPLICLGCFLLLLSPRVRLRIIRGTLLEWEWILLGLSLEQVGYLQLLRGFVLENGFLLFNRCYWLWSLLFLRCLSNFGGLFNFFRAGNLSIGGLLEWARFRQLNWLCLLNWFGLCKRSRLSGRISLLPWICRSWRCSYTRLYGARSISSGNRWLHLFSGLILFNPRGIIGGGLSRQSTLESPFNQLLFKPEDALEIRYRLCLGCFHLLFRLSGRCGCT